MAAKKILHQFDIQAVTSLSNPGTGYVGFSAKADGLYQKIGAGSDLRLLTTSDAAGYQPKNSELTAIAEVGGDVGFLRKTNTNSWTLDTSTYALSTHTHSGAYQPLDNALTNLAGVGTGLLPEMSGVVIMWLGTQWGYGTPWTSMGYITASHNHNGIYALLAGSNIQPFNTANLAVTGTVTINKQGSGAELLRFNTERPWNFTQYNSGANSELWLNDLSGFKTFKIVDSINGGNVSFSNGAVVASTQITAPNIYADRITTGAAKFTTGAGDGKILTSNATGDAIWADPVLVSVPAASENTPGTVEVATSAEVAAMGDMLRSLTPYNLSYAFTNSTGNNGYVGIPIGFGSRLIIQYGSFSASGNGTCTFPIAFPLYCFAVVFTAGDGIGRIPSKTRFSFVWQDVLDAITSSAPCYWMAIGK